MTGFIDISLPLHPGVVNWPGSTPFCVRKVADLECGDVANESFVGFNVHSGTHLDAPLHFISSAAALSSIGLDVLIGSCRVVDLRGHAAITAAALEGLQFDEAVTRILFRTDNSALLRNRHPFCEGYCALSEDGARWLVERGVLLVGIDYLSIAPFSDPATVHRMLLSAGIAVLEGVDLTDASPGCYELICLPMPLLDTEAAPCRVLLRELQP